MAALTVFLSASPADAAFAARLRQAIIANGGKVVSPDSSGSAASSGSPGDGAPSTSDGGALPARELKSLEDARAYVAVLSPAAAGSARFQREAERYAGQAGQQGKQSASRHNVVPVQLTPPAPESAVPALQDYTPVTGPYGTPELQDQLIAETLRRLGLPAERSRLLPLLLIAALLALLLFACLGLAVMAPGGSLHFLVRGPSATPTPVPTVLPTATTAPTGTGLYGQYYRSRSIGCCVSLPDDLFGQPLFSRVDSQLNMRTADSQESDPRLAGGAYAVRWTGQIVPTYSETYSIITHSDDGIRVWINGNLVIDDWSTHDERVDQATVAMTANQHYDIKVEYYENGIGDAVMELQWQSPSQPLEVVPASQLYPAQQG